MEHNTPERRITLSLSWNDGGKRRFRELSFAPASLARIAFILLLCAASYKLGLKQGGWEAEARAPRNQAHGEGTVSVQPPASPLVAPGAVAAPGQAFGEAGDVITPLNVWDPAALVMAPAW